MEIQTISCPLCGRPPIWLFGHMAFCGDENCKSVCWPVDVPLDDLLTNVTFIKETGP